ncbi:LOW QUALITY PROTEIN: rho GTPase-activating protein 23-like [Mastacembelus armatus]|uniref:LOW QUALITY PROTEIN: rho GTPase-activating protein 23-like n=1 Tax=Mastacembelus armatus TaxID=205130 RepID=UPI000E45D2B3|nr:LOW QUALITY PROTEIN: rho GTPase-activating protein 23-like [Mastacembelus armatus]
MQHCREYSNVSLAWREDEENGNALRQEGCQRPCLEPMDTIFVKCVKENGPAQQAGLCTGDRLVKVNGENILGRTYSQVIALIQNSENIIELSIMPKDEDVLQLVYSQDAYLKGSEPYTDEGQDFPELPPLCYTSTMPISIAPEPSHNLHSCLDNCLHPASNPTSSWPMCSEDSIGHVASSQWHRDHSSSAISALDFHFANHNSAIASATLPPPRKSSLPASARIHAGAHCQQALSHWYFSQTQASEHMSPNDHSILHDHLAGLKLGMSAGCKPSPSATSAEQQRTETFIYHHQAASASNDPYCLGGFGGVSGPGNKTFSESLLAAYVEYEHNYGRSVEILAQASALVSPHYKHTSQSPQMTKFSKKTASGEHQHKRVTSPITTFSTVPPSDKQSGQQIAEQQIRRVKEELVDYKSYSLPFSCKDGNLIKQVHSISETGILHKPQSTSTLSASAQVGEDKDIGSLHQEVFPRLKPPLDCLILDQALHQPHSITPMDSPEPPGLAPASISSVEPGPSHRANDILAKHAFDSLSSIPFKGNVKGRRSSYLLAISTERSKSCDEGLDTFREGGHAFFKLPKRVKSFFTDESLVSLRAQEDTQSKRHSTSELGTITFSDACKEGWLHYKQILSEKGKKVGGGMWPWKRVFSVLRFHSLFLYKDKREAVLHGAGAGPSQEEHLPICIHGCLVDIAYSETKRKHTLRLTTQDFCEYLLHAEDRDDMLAWIRVIRENSKTDNEEISFSREALINKKLNDFRKHSLTGNKSGSSPHYMMLPFLLVKTNNTSVNQVSRIDDNKVLWGINIIKKAKKTSSPKAFGVRLEDCQPAVNHKFVPLIVEICCSVVEEMGLEYTGIYRVPGNNAMVFSLQEQLNKGMDINTAEETWQDLNVISSLLKTFFRKLPESLFTDDKYSEFVAANRIEDAEDRLKTMKKLIHDLPDHYYHTLKFLVGHLKRVADHSEKNKMEPRNLALVFGPTLVRTSGDNMTDMVTHMPDRYRIVETLILHHDWFFSDGELNEKEKVIEDNWDMQPVPNIDHLLSNIGRPGMARETAESVDQPF